MNKNRDAACRYRTRARELRALAEHIDDDENRKLLLSVADEYEQMAKQVSQR